LLSQEIGYSPNITRFINRIFSLVIICFQDIGGKIALQANSVKEMTESNSGWLNGMNVLVNINTFLAGINLNNRAFFCKIVKIV
jgi:hypothetical protein